MARSVLDRFGEERLRDLRSFVAYDPTAENGLRWIGPKQKGGRRAELARTFWIGDCSYQAPQVVLVLNGIFPLDDKQVAAKVDPKGAWSDVGNLCWSNRGISKRANEEARRVAVVESQLGSELPQLPENQRLGLPCKKGHTWNGYQLTLQVKWGRSWRCKECITERESSPEGRKLKQERGKRNYYKHLERKRAQARERMAAKLADPEYRQIASERRARRRAELGRESRAKGLEALVLPHRRSLTQWEARAVRRLVAEGHPLDWAHLEPLVISLAEMEKIAKTAINNAGRSPSVARLVMDEQRRYWRENPEAKKEHDRQWDKAKWQFDYLTKPELRLYTRQKSKRRKAQMRESVAIQLSGKDIRARFQQFDHRCAYCGAGGELHVEHVVPISKGGPHALGNIVPACRRCNFSKTDHEAETWYRRQPFFSELRWRKICRVLGWAKSSVGQLALL